MCTHRTYTLWQLVQRRWWVAVGLSTDNDVHAIERGDKKILYLHTYIYKLELSALKMGMYGCI